MRGAVASLGQPLAARWPRLADRALALATGAGLAQRVSAAELLGWKVLLLLVGCGIGLASARAWLVLPLLLLPILAALGWCVPDIWLHRRCRARQLAMFRDLPTAMDLLALSLEAGMGLDRALRVISDRFESPLTEEFQQTLAEMSLGASRGEAFANLAARTRLEEVRLLATSITQSEQMGTSLATAMQAQARQLRVSRRRRAEALALEAPTKMAFPMVAFILPVLFLIVLGAPALQLLRALGQGNA